MKTKHENSNMKTNTLYYGDCLEVMSKWRDNSVDLIYLDPPFNSNVNYNILFGTGRHGIDRNDLAQLTAFVDTWDWDDKAAARIHAIEKAIAHPAHAAIVALHVLHPDGSGMLSYLSYMAERLAEMKRLLKDAGSIYLHCDPTASHYLKMIMDEIFGAKNFRNEIVWLRKHDRHNLATKHMGRAHDVILYYAKSTNTKYNKQFTDYFADYVKTAYRHMDNRGEYRTLPCTNEAGGNAPYEFRGLTRAWRFKKQRMQKMFDDGLLVQATPTSPFQYKKYFSEARGVPIQDLWTDIKAVRGKGENLDYPTQKPLKLLDRIIAASSNEGDVVLDPFCGCGTTVESAHNLNRQWLGIDISTYAIEVIRRERMKDLHIELEGVPKDIEAAMHFAKHKPFDFEKWAVTRIPGFAPNAVQVGGGGVDGRAKIYHAPKDADLCIAQVKGGEPKNEALRAFYGIIASGKAAVGIFITLKKWNTPAVKKIIAQAGVLQVGASQFPRLVMYFIEDYFNAVEAKLPPLAHPRTGEPLHDDLLGVRDK